MVRSAPGGHGLETPQPCGLGPAASGACHRLDQLCRGEGWSLSQWRRELEEPERTVLGIPQAGTLLALGSTWLILDELHITLVLVDPAHRRRGLGARILRSLLEQGRARGAARATLEVAAGNGPALALYAGFGFVTAGCRRGYYRDGQDALIQWCQFHAMAG
jgi:ribosomal-protein-alanine N-acetyltransferase